MKPFDIPSMHPSRTRGAATSAEERNPFLIRVGKVIPGDKDGQTEEYVSSVWVWRMDALSTLLSIGAFITACVFAFGKNHKGITRFDDHIKLWRESVYVVSSDLAVADHRNDLASALQSSVQGMESALVDFCPNGNVKLFNETRIWDDKTYSGTAVIHPYGSFSPWGVLLWIFFVSVVFQGSRLGELRVNGVTFRVPSKWLWNVVYDCDKVTYDARKPDFWRWLEYALTSPFQILLVATSVFIQERGHLMALMGLQGALVLLGFLNEKRIDKFYKKALKREMVRSNGPQHTDTRVPWSRPKITKIVVSTLLSWCFFTIIWYTIIHRFQEQVDNLDKCHYVAKMPREVRFIVWTQCLLFGLFGLAQLVQVFYTTLYKDRKVLQSSQLQDMPTPGADFWFYNVVLFSAGIGIVYELVMLMGGERSWWFLLGWLVLLFGALWVRLKTPADTDTFFSFLSSTYQGDTYHVTTIKTLRQKRWDTMAFRYSFLSVTAKTLLEYGFIALVLVREDMTP